MTRYLISSLGLALGAALGFAWWQAGRIETLQGDNARLSANKLNLERSLRQAIDAAARASKVSRQTQALRQADTPATRTLIEKGYGHETAPAAVREYVDGGL